MRLTPEVEKYLGNAYIVVSEGKQAAITSGSWAIIFSDAEKYIDREILDFAKQQSYNHGQKVDYRVINGRDFTSDRFLPAHGKELEPILLDRHRTSVQGYERVEELLEKSTYAFDGVDLTEILNAGKATPAYNTSTKGISRIISGNHEAQSYLFNVDNKVVNIAGDLLRGVTEAGLRTVLNTDFCPEECKSPQPALGLVDPEDPGVMGLLMPLNSSNIKEDSQGRTMHVDPARACWVSPAMAEEMIKQDFSFFDPSVCSIAEDLTVEERIKSRRYGDAVIGISALRWHGASEEEINKVINYASYDAWCSLYHQALKHADGLLTEVDIFSRDSSELTTSVVRRIRGFSSRTKSLCERVESLSKLMEKRGGDGSLGYGSLPELVNVITDLESLCDS